MNKDYLLDTIALHDVMGLLRPVFANPVICKVILQLFMLKSFQFIYLFAFVKEVLSCHRCFMVPIMMFSGFKEISTSMLSIYLTRPR